MIIPKQKTQQELEKQVENFNSKHKIGDKLKLKMDSGEIREVELKSEATILYGHSAVAFFEGISGAYSIDRIKLNFRTNMKYQICNRIKYSNKTLFSRELEKEFNIPGSALRDMIRELRREGIPIANSSKGYFYAKNYEEIKSTIEDLKNRAYSMLETAKKIESNFKKEAQESLFG